MRNAPAQFLLASRLVALVLGVAWESRAADVDPARPSDAATSTTRDAARGAPGQTREAVPAAEAASARTGDSAGEGDAPAGAGGNAAATASSESVSREALQLERARASGDAHEIGAALIDLGRMHLRGGSPKEALAVLEEAIEVANRDRNDNIGRAAALTLGDAYHDLKQYDEAERWVERANAYRDQLPERFSAGTTTATAAAVGTDPGVVPATVADAAASASPPGTTAAGRTPDVNAIERMLRQLRWWLALFAVLLVFALWQASRRASGLRARTELLAREQRKLQSANRTLRNETEKYRQLAVQDALTGTMNRQAFAGNLEKLLEHARTFAKPVSLMVFDLDHFKEINDRHGHLAGDGALILVVGVVRDKLGSGDLFGRFGGDEFLVACPDLDRERARSLAEDIRASVQERALRHVPIAMPDLSVSIGVAHAPPGQVVDVPTLFHRADTALYAAKQGGRNRVVLEDNALPSPPKDRSVSRSLVPE